MINELIVRRRHTAEQAPAPGMQRNRLKKPGEITLRSQLIPTYEVQKAWLAEFLLAVYGTEEFEAVAGEYQVSNVPVCAGPGWHEQAVGIRAGKRTRNTRLVLEVLAVGRLIPGGTYRIV